MNWTVRQATADDDARLALVGAATFLESFAGVLDGDAIVAHCARMHSAEAYRHPAAAGAHAWLGEAAEGRAPIGFALLGRPDLPAAGGGDLQLKRIYTLSRFHGSGLGPALLSQAVDHACHAGAHRLLLGVYEGDARARTFYAKNGFAPLATRGFGVGDRDYADVVLAKVLPSPHRGAPAAAGKDRAAATVTSPDRAAGAILQPP